MQTYLTLKYDGQDKQRLQKVIQGDAFRDVLEETIKHLYWWYFERDDEMAKAFALTYEFINSELASRGVGTRWKLVGKIKTRDGKVVEKTEADFSQISGDKNKQPTDASPKEA